VDEIVAEAMNDDPIRGVIAEALAAHYNARKDTDGPAYRYGPQSFWSEAQAVLDGLAAKNMIVIPDQP
jgi:hypothetical protein